MLGHGATVKCQDQYELQIARAPAFWDVDGSGHL
jgi:hypothetical protein